jgi:hypothetical protein
MYFTLKLVSKRQAREAHAQLILSATAAQGDNKAIREMGKKLTKEMR